MHCTRCGHWFSYLSPTSLDAEPTDDLCHDCQVDYDLSMAAEYPYGYCHDCGAPGRAWQCEQLRTHILYTHIEGACRQWRDGGEYPSPQAIAAGYCAAGCRPVLLAARLGDGSAELPF